MPDPNPSSRPTIAIVQARMRSQRLPGKVMMAIGDVPAVHHVLSRTRLARRVDEVWLACSEAGADDLLAEYAGQLGFKVFRGSEDDVLGRFAALARKVDAGAIVRITADCPMIDPALIDAVAERYAAGGADFVSNTIERTYPDGLDVEMVSRAALERADREAQHPYLRQHVTPYIQGQTPRGVPSGGFARALVKHDADFSHLRWTLDESEDLEFFRRLVPRLRPGYGWQEALALLTREPNLMRVNRGHGINEGAARDFARMNGRANEPRSYAASNAYFERAVRTIPLATQTFSKSYMQWVFGASPLFIRNGQGCRVTDLDDNRYIDYVLGLLPVVLGYRDPDVDAAIEAQLDQGITFSLPHPTEAELAEELVRLIPCAEMVRFGKNGSDATTAAVRLARAHTGRDKIALCGYHGWHDWYIGTTARRLGVPEAVQALSTPIPFNDADALAKLLAAEPEAYAAVILEADGAAQPEPGYLQRLRELTERYGVVLVFDEIITGFRMAMGGAQAYHGVTPDLAAFGKALANGMPISAIVGRKSIMKRMEDVFFSGTFGGEALSIGAALATLKKLQSNDVVNRLWATGARLRDGANAAFAARGLGGCLRFIGDGWWPRLKVTEPPVDANLLNSLLRQEFTANGLLLAASFNLCLAHDEPHIVDETIVAIDRSAAAVREALDRKDPTASLRGRPMQPVFAVR